MGRRQFVGGAAGRSTAVVSMVGVVWPPSPGRHGHVVPVRAYWVLPPINNSATNQSSGPWLADQVATNQTVTGRVFGHHSPW